MPEAENKYSETYCKQLERLIDFDNAMIAQLTAELEKRGLEWGIDEITNRVTVTEVEAK